MSSKAQLTIIINQSVNTYPITVVGSRGKCLMQQVCSGDISGHAAETTD